ncbi:hypothetical protein AO372_1709 [Moraxella catarrhalis]|uniref:hypothetical protein n=1 Tax=Moraxella catarrhalis TaxID=480 RepID=UPI0007E443DC|nr:hypothetical protein [Moraxella catarrhalis]OAV11246.1 hypothetical protein AO377_0411 [Moraxella catarrhalis]OAV13644.1 hypothetical protein AO375_1514 [Moraxella catarrhalis]OAV20019.1 hypothetical protein AO372_1709 [Moraxella catarrhalis]OAV33894.1 hypothetical protein AO365_1693 [Moraxella catarrhalis]
MYDNDKKLTTIVGVLYTVYYAAIWLVSGYILWGWIGVTGFTRAILWLIAWMIVGTIADRIFMLIILTVVGRLSSIFFEKRR